MAQKGSIGGGITVSALVGLSTNVLIPSADILAVNYDIVEDDGLWVL